MAMEAQPRLFGGIGVQPKNKGIAVGILTTMLVGSYVIIVSHHKFD